MGFSQPIYRSAGLVSLLIAPGVGGRALGALQGPVTVAVPPAVRSMAATAAGS